MKEVTNSDRLDRTVTKTKKAIEIGSREIDEIVIDTRMKIHDLRLELVEVSTRLGFVISEVDRLVNKRKMYLKEHRDSKTVEQEKEYQDIIGKLLVEQNLEEQLNSRRNNIELYLRNNGSLLERSEKVLTQVHSMLEIIGEEAAPSVQAEMLLSFQEIEKKRMSRDIHDGPAQTMSGILLKAEYADKVFESDPIRAKREIATIQDDIRQMIREIREIIFNLTPANLEKSTLKQAIEVYAERYPKIVFDLKIEQHAECSSTMKGNLFRIVQESMNNIVRHSGSKRAQIYVTVDKMKIIAKIRDFGRGFDLYSDHRGYGIQNIRDRVQLSGGEMTIDSKKGKGTVIKVLMPNEE